MNKLTIIGNLTRDPELRSTSVGVNVCDFTVAVNRRVRRDSQNGQPEADFFRVSAWRQLGENCAKYLTKGRKVCVVGPVSVRTYQASDGSTRASLEVTAEDVEFLSPRTDADASGSGYSAGGGYTPAPAADAQPSGFTEVETDELPF
jgi:single-strand DNA-binding protein